MFEVSVCTSWAAASVPLDLLARLPPCRDNMTGFFDKCFPTLLKRIFGYDDFEASWLNLVAKVGVPFPD